MKLIDIAANKTDYFDELWIIPCGTWDDRPDLSPGEVWIEMLKKNIEYYGINKLDRKGKLIEKVKINPIEINHGKLIPTYFLLETLWHIPENHDCEFFFIIGSDLVPKIETWENGSLLKQFENFLIFKLEGGLDLKPEDYPKRYVYIQTSEISKQNSSDIRMVISSTDWQSHETSSVLGEATIQYMKENPDLYKLLSH